MKPNLVVKSMKVKAIPESSILNWSDSAVLVRINLTPQNASIHHVTTVIATLWQRIDFLPLLLHVCNALVR